MAKSSVCICSHRHSWPQDLDSTEHLLWQLLITLRQSWPQNLDSIEHILTVLITLRQSCGQGSCGGFCGQKSALTAQPGKGHHHAPVQPLGSRSIPPLTLLTHAQYSLLSHRLELPHKLCFLREWGEELWIIYLFLALPPKNTIWLEFQLN